MDSMSEPVGEESASSSVRWWPLGPPPSRMNFCEICGGWAFGQTSPNDPSPDVLVA